MARYIDADELKESLEDFSKWCRDGRKQGVDFVLDCPLPNTPTADVAPRAEWISAEERLPEVAGREYLVWDNVQKTAKKRFFYRLPPSIPLETYPYRREYFGNSADYKRYTHWMPLPEPPDMKGGE